MSIDDILAYDEAQKNHKKRDINNFQIRSLYLFLKELRKKRYQTAHQLYFATGLTNRLITNIRNNLLSNGYIGMIPNGNRLSKPLYLTTDGINLFSHIENIYKVV